MCLILGKTYQVSDIYVEFELEPQEFLCVVNMSTWKEYGLIECPPVIKAFVLKHVNIITF